jgi:hypothetical protein
MRIIKAPYHPHPSRGKEIKRNKQKKTKQRNIEVKILS